MNCTITRRTLLKAAGLSLTVSAVPAARAAATSTTTATLSARPGHAAITRGETPATAIWGYDGQVPGPLLRLRQNDTLEVKLKNDLPQPTSIHWHGIRIDNAMDGSPLVQQPVEPGDSFDYRFTTPDAGTYWYHTHTRGYEQLTRGLYGVLIVDEAEPLAESFDQEHILVIDDWLLDKEGQIDEETIGAMMHMSHGGRSGNWASVNGVNKPEISVDRGGRTRMRLINTCNARILDLDFGELDVWTIALDGQPVAPARLENQLVLAPGQRVDLAMDIPENFSEPKILGIAMRDSIYEAAYFVASDKPPLKPRDNSPEALADNPQSKLVLNLDNPLKVTLDMQGGAMGRMREASLGGKMTDIRTLVRSGKVWAFNGIADMDTAQQPLFEARRGSTVTLDITNNTSWPHAMHLHGHHFRQIRADGNSVTPGPWRDTHLMERGEQHTMALVADNPGDWLIHCHMVEHAASGMTGWFRVT